MSSTGQQPYYGRTGSIPRALHGQHQLTNKKNTFSTTRVVITKQLIQRAYRMKDGKKIKRLTPLSGLL